MQARYHSEDGVALVAAVVLTGVVIALGVLMIAVSLRSNQTTVSQKVREGAFQAADAGVSDAIACLMTLTSGTFSSGVTACNSELSVASARTQLTDENRMLGQYEATITDVTSPATATVRTIQIDAAGYGPQKADARFSRTIRARVRLDPLSGFNEAIFAGGPAPADGLVELKNNAEVNGSVYARNLNIQKNLGRFGAVRVVGDFQAKNNAVYESIWSGGDVTLGNQTTVNLDLLACGDPVSGKGNVTLANNSSIGGNLVYRGTSSPSDPDPFVAGTINTPTNFCAPPEDVGLPDFTYDATNYLAPNFNPSQTVIEFTGTGANTAANACLAQTNTTLQPAVCKNVTLGSANSTIGRSNGLVVRVNDPGCPSSGVQTRLSNSWTFENNVTVVTNCTLALGGTWGYATTHVSSAQAVFVSEEGDIRTAHPNNLTSLSAALNILLLAEQGDFIAQNNVTIASGSIYAENIDMQNNLDISASASLAENPPPGFVFDIAARYIPNLEHWEETGT